jgi:hypothetical protein
MSEARVKK